MSTPTVPTTKIYSGQADNQKVTIDRTHAEVHEGNAYTTSFTRGVGANAFIYFSLVPQNIGKKCHLIHDISSTSLITFTFCEGTGSLVTGSLVATPTINLNRVANDTGSLRCYSSVTTGSGTTGSNISTLVVGTTAFLTTPGSIAKRDYEWILNPTVIYVGILSSSAANNQVNFQATWYEE